MNAPTDVLRLERLDTVLALAASRLPAERRPMFEGFAREYFRQLDDDDLVERTPEDLSGAVLSHWQFAATRTPGAPKVRVLSPTLAEDGWASRHSVIEIVNDDMPFLVDSTTTEINRQGLTLHLIVHPIFAVERDAGGRLASIDPRREAPEAARESWMHVEVDRLVDVQQRSELVAGIERVLGDVRAAVEDWKPMLARLQEAIAELDTVPASLPAAQVAESRAFLQWLADDHFTLLGYRRHDLVTEHGEDRLRLVPGSGLGVLRETAAEQSSASFAALPPQARALAHDPLPVLVVTKANTRSTVHRPGYTDYVGVKRYDAGGKVIGEHRFLGLLTSTAYSARVAETPLLRGKVEAIVERAGLPPGGHLAKALDHILETYPRDELFQISDDELYDTALGILALGDRQRLRLFVRRDPFERFVSCLVFVPRDAYSTDLRVKFQRILMAAFAGTAADFDVLLGDTVLARIHFMVRTTPGHIPAFDRKELEARLAAAARRWADQLRDALIDAEGEARGIELFKRWGAAFPPDYRERVPARGAVPDVRKIASLSTDSPLALALYRPLGAGAGALGFKVYRLGEPVVLSDSLPMLEHMGVRVLGEQHASVETTGAAVSLHDFELEVQGAGDIEPETLARLFEDAFARVFRGEVENDDFNRLVLRAGLAADEIVVLRAYAKYLKQIGFALSQATIEATLAAHPRIARMLVRPVQAALRPGRARRAGRDRAGQRDRAGAREGQQPVRGPRAAPAAGADPGDAAHQLLAHRRRPLGRARPAPQLPLLQARLGQGAGAARAEAAVRDLRLLAALRGHPPARRQGRARRPALVGPAGGLPHRSARPGEGADGEEHRHRAGRLQGRLRAEEGAAAVGPRRLHEGRRRLLPGLPARPARPHRQPGRHDGRAAAAGGAHRRRRPVPRGRRRQGHRDLLRLRQRHQQGVRPLAGRRLRLRRQRRLRPQGHGHHRARRLGEREALLPRAGHRHPDDADSPWSASATCRATCSATACCCRGTSGWSPRSTTATSSSTRTPTPPRRSPSASACSSCRARRGPTTTRS